MATLLSNIIAPSNVLLSSDIGSTVQSYDSNLTSFVSAFTLPTTDSTNGYALTTNGSGTLSFSAVSSSNNFSNVLLSDSTNIAADSSGDTLNLSSAGLIAITGNATTDTITVSTPSTAAIPFLKADESSSNIELQTSGSIGQVLTNLYIPFTKADGSAVETLVVGSN